ncbi:ataxin-7-like protein 2b isoform X2 [Melanotaenia boesemani]|nr:ataxin-7-like protein 2b isoform X2 [Melanotaenia boesemani]XP_041859478.1 ataxin-7-like protein 2b isoform X2 [Melanotaenia boesemani]
MHRSDTMTLGKEDMDIFGHCPAHDNFYLVVCSHCGQVVKPQAFERHCERWHSAITRICGQSSILASQQLPSPDWHPLNIPSCVEKLKCNKDSALSSAVLPANRHCPKNVHNETVRVPPWHSGPLPPDDDSSFTSLSKSHSLQQSATVELTGSNIPLQGMKTYSRINKNVNKKDYELNKHCTVVDPERKKLCNRELICNAKSIAEHQKASEKLYIVGQLAVEQKKVSEGQDRERHPNSFDANLTTRGSKCLILRNPSENSPEEDSNGAVEVEIQPPYPFNQSLLSSEDSEEEDEEEEATDLPATPWHPKPLGLCTFGCHTLGVSIYTFDRRLHHLRFALSAMMDRHVNAHLWRKMPQVSSGLRSHHVSPPATGTSVRDVDKPSKSTAPFSHESTSKEQQEIKNFQQNCHISMPPYSTTTTSFGSGKHRYPIVRPRKAQMMEVELMQDAKPALKASKLLHSDEDISSRYIRGRPLHEMGKSHVPAFQRPAKSNISQEEKPCFPPPVRHTERQISDLAKPAHHPPTSRESPPAIQQKMDSDHRCSAQKRKSSTKSLPVSSSASRTSKYKCFSSLSCPSLIS